MTEIDYMSEDVTLVDLADRMLGKGVAVSGDIVLSVAGVDLVYISLRALLASVEAAMDLGLDRHD
jgi:hypothetical protein